MKYRIIYTRTAARDISRLEWEIRDRVRKATERCAEAPQNYARKMINPSIGTYRLRAGDYRIIFDLEDDEMIVLRVGHRREIYKGR